MVDLVAVAVAKTQAQKEIRHQDLAHQDLHIHYHMELLLDMVVTVVVDIVDLQTTVMVVAAVVPVLMEVPNLTEANPLVRVVLEEHLLLEETPTPLQVVAVEDVGTLIQIEKMVEQLVPVVALPVVVMVLVKKLTRVIQLFLVAGVTG